MRIRRIRNVITSLKIGQVLTISGLGGIGTLVKFAQISSFSQIGSLNSELIELGHSNEPA